METTTDRDFAAMRQGKAVGDFVSVTNKHGHRVVVAIVPLTEAEFENSLRLAALEEVPDNQMGLELRERVQTREIVYAAHRSDSDLTVRHWDSPEEMAEEIDHSEVNNIFDHYLE